MGTQEVLIFAVETAISILLIIGFMYEEKVAAIERKIIKAVKRICRKLF